MQDDDNNDNNNNISGSLVHFDNEDFKALRRVATDPSTLETLTSADMDKIGRAVTSTFRMCCTPQSQLISEAAEGDLHVILLQWVVKARAMFWNMANRTSRHNALNILFHKTIITSANLQALLAMCNPKNLCSTTNNGRTLRCRALLLLHLLANQDHRIYRIPIRDDHDDDPGNDNNNNSNSEPSTTTIFLKRLILTMADAVSCKSANCGATDSNYSSGLANTSCRYCNTPIAWICLTNSMGAAPGILNDLEMLHFLDSMNWNKILCYDKEIPDYTIQADKKRGEPVLSFDFPVFVSMHGQTVALLKKDPINVQAKHFLRNQLGACHELLRRCMRRIINGTVYATPPPHERRLQATAAASNNHDYQQELLAEIQPAIAFILAFTRCLAPVPVDRETMSLVRRGRLALVEPFLSNGGSVMAGCNDTMAIHHFTLALAALFEWQQLHSQTDEVRWAKFQQEFFISSSAAAGRSRDNNNKKKKFWKEFKNVRKEAARRTTLASVQNGEMCSNCFVMENDIKREGGYLSKCALCAKMKYCSRECQVEHWKKAHRMACEGKK